MNYPTKNPLSSGAAVGPVSGSLESALHLIANPPIPEGLEDRIHATLRSAPRTGRLLSWPLTRGSGDAAMGGWMRAVAAAAIVFVVAGGGWSVYSRVEHGQPAKVAVMPPRGAAPAGGFSSAGAMRTPQTLHGPVLTHPLPKHPLHARHAKKTLAPGAPAGAGKAATPPPAAAAK